MANQLTSNAEALRLFFTEDIYLLPENNVADMVEKIESVKVNIAFKYLGKNQKNILILVNDQQNDVSTEEGRELLRKLVKAIGLTANDFALVNYAGYKEQKFEDFRAAFDCKLVLAFGVAAVDLGLPQQAQHQLSNYGDIKLVFTTNLADLDQDQASKKLLWASLQQLK
jgi:hypothetical protein